MTHPGLPQEQQIEVDEVSVPHYRAAGWRAVTGDTTDTTTTPTARRRRQTQTGDEG
ncbi:hypothetical protein [Streptomyces sp. CC228A]|uniref:hypothetical protein n=1 Tax=Streptomyces sp. CC228A TaxID=2898186 RepID=UPI001F36360E|nr:hypothetical protein [Streptomyces sp. CC228A]